MSFNYVKEATLNFEPDVDEPLMDSLFEQYEHVIVQSIITSFGLDFLVQDRHGGDVDTIHNVRQIGKDSEMTYKNKQNEADYDAHGEYDSTSYHSHQNYKAINREISRQRKDGNLKDGYTGKFIARNEKSDLDHTVSAKEIHEDRGRILAELKGENLANSSENLTPTNPHTNRSKKADSMDEFLERCGGEYTESEKNRMQQMDKKARKAYDQKLSRAYYTSKKFQKDVAISAGKVATGMGARQALGFVFTEIWFCVKEELNKINDSFELGEAFYAIGNGIKRGWESAMKKYKELFSKFLNGAVAGAMASLTTTLCNIFLTTAKNIVTIIRQSWASIVEALKILFINPEGYALGDRIRAVVKVIATGASIVAGTIVSELIRKTGIGAVPIVGEVVSSFCGAFVSGILSCTLLYFLDRSSLVNTLVEWLNKLDLFSEANKLIDYFKRQAVYFEEYAAKLMQLDVEKFRKEVAMCSILATNIENARDDKELNSILYSAVEKLGVKLSWKDHESFDDFMNDKNAVMVFE